MPVIAGAGSNSTEETIMLTAHAKKVGADGALLITPYYNKPTQEGDSIPNSPGISGPFDVGLFRPSGAGCADYHNWIASRRAGSQCVRGAIDSTRTCARAFDLQMLCHHSGRSRAEVPPSALGGIPELLVLGRSHLELVHDLIGLVGTPQVKNDWPECRRCHEVRAAVR